MVGNPSFMATCGMIKPLSADMDAEEIWKATAEAIQASGLSVSTVVHLRLEKEDAEIFYAVHRNKPFFGELVDYITRGSIVALFIVGENAGDKWRQIIGPTNCSDPNSLRGRFGRGIAENVFHGSDSTESANSELKFFFPNIVS